MAESATLDAAASSASVSNVVASASAVISEAAKASESAQKVIDEALGHTGKSTSSKIIGVTLAIVSGLLIGASFVVRSLARSTSPRARNDLSAQFKKKGLLASQKDAEKAGEGHAYLKSVMWWTGMMCVDFDDARFRPFEVFAQHHDRRRDMQLCALASTIKKQAH